jgi:hypothetical protein
MKERRWQREQLQANEHQEEEDREVERRAHRPQHPFMQQLQDPRENHEEGRALHQGHAPVIDGAEGQGSEDNQEQQASLDRKVVDARHLVAHAHNIGR